MEKVKLGKKELIDRLYCLDDDLSYLIKGEKIELVIVGGAALILGDYRERTTSDVDVNKLFPAAFLEIFNKYDINTNVIAYSDSFAYNYEDRLTLFDGNFKTLVVKIISLEDLVISKLHGERQKDKDDIRSKSVIAKINWDLLDRIAHEECNYSFNKKQYDDFLTRYNEYVKEFNK